MQTTDQVAGEAREKLADKIASGITFYGRNGTMTVFLSPAERDLVLAALRAQPERGAEDPRDVLQGLDPRFTFEQHAAFFRQIAEHWTGATREGYLDHANKIEAAIRALPLHPAKDEGGGR